MAHYPSFITPHSLPFIHALVASPRLAHVGVAAVHDIEKMTEAVYFMKLGYRLGYSRRAASAPRYPIVPPVWADMKSNSLHRTYLRIDRQAGRPKGQRTMKRSASNGEFHTSLRYNAIDLAHDNSLFKGGSLSQGGLYQSGSSEAPIDVGS